MAVLGPRFGRPDGGGPTSLRGTSIRVWDVDGGEHQGDAERTYGVHIEVYSCDFASNGYAHGLMHVLEGPFTLDPEHIAARDAGLLEAVERARLPRDGGETWGCR